jgi:hypothetical protein
VVDVRGPLGAALAGRCLGRSPTPFRCCFMALAGVVSDAVSGRSGGALQRRLQGRAGSSKLCDLTNRARSRT